MKKLFIITILLILTGCQNNLGEISPTQIVIYKEISELTPEQKKETYIAAERNYDGIQYEDLRKIIDPKFNQVHDALSQAYYEEKEFSWKGTDYGTLDKETFDKLHGLIFLKRDVDFHEENLKQPEPYSEEEYNDIYDEEENIINKKYLKAQEKIEQYQNEGINIDL